MDLQMRVAHIGCTLDDDYFNLKYPKGRISQDFSHFIASNYIGLESLFEYLVRYGFSKSSFLDLGSGNGLVAMMATVYGMDAVGIELDSRLVKRSNLLLGRLRRKGAIKDKCKFIHGNYFPAYICEELARKPMAERKKIEVKIAEDPYKRLGRKFSSFDIIFNFPWEEQEDSIYDLFVREGVPGQLLIINSWHEIEMQHSNPRLQEVFDISRSLCAPRANYRAFMLKDQEKVASKVA